ncbi:MAG: hypothetical protein KKA60_13435 [Proteobacteria bacterium]|nr:hypothetical protein [Pseudomonadota bacterium]
MDLTCGNCGHKASKVEFRYLNRADSAGAATYRQCPACRVAVYCEEMEDEGDYAQGRVWGTSKLRGTVFTRENRPKKSGGEGGEG